MFNETFSNVAAPPPPSCDPIFAMVVGTRMAASNPSLVMRSYTIVHDNTPSKVSHANDANANANTNARMVG